MAVKSRTSSGPWKRWQTVVLTAVATSSVLLALLVALLPVPHEDEIAAEESELRLAQASAAMQRQDYRTAEQLAASVAVNSSVFPQSRLVAGEAATRDGRITDALAHYLQIADGSSSVAVTSAFSIAEIYRSDCQIEKAQQWYRKVLTADPHDDASHERMAFLLGITRQHWEAAPHYFALVKSKAWTLDSLAILSDIERSIDQPEYIAQCAAEAPEDLWVQLALAAEQLYMGQPEAARPLLSKIVTQQPELVAAQAMLGELLLGEEGAGLEQWNASLPLAAEEHPDVWFVRGMQCRKAQRAELAAGCFAITVSLVPEHRRATYQLGQMLTQLDAPEAEPFVQRAKQQTELGLLLDQVLATRGKDVTKLRAVTEICETLGRVWEAWAWALTAQQLHPQATWPKAIAARCGSQLQSTPSRTTSTANLLTRYKLRDYISVARKHAWRSQTTQPSRNPNPSDLVGSSQIQFQTASGVGIDFVYSNGPDPITPGARMFEQTGGGVGAFDYDNDGWPDLYFTQGGEWKTGDNQPSPTPGMRDYLYRNRDGVRFEEVAIIAGIEDLSFSQGVAMGDVDADGFADLFVANIGPNRLWHNNGDGTFTESSEQLHDVQSQWTTSAAMVDLNNDGLVDIFEVNYLEGDSVFQEICAGKGCSPKGFEGARDQVRINLGDGEFQLIENACPDVDSKGLGVVAFHLDDNPRPALLVANDQVANHLLVSDVDQADTLHWRDEALLRGLAFNSDGLPMASMGIAADDVDQNGLLDLLITNFRNESDTLFLQDAPGLFVDGTPTAGMQSANFPYVGWGTQFLDADLDGGVDAVVVNGNVDDYRSDGGEWEMPAQLYRNVGKGRFAQIHAADAGDFFRQRYAARALAKLDWNRDGLTDFVLSNIGTPAVLVTNVSPSVGHQITFSLHGTRSAREPIGAIITVETDKGSWTKQLTAGDGFQASNERVVQFGLGRSTRINSVQISWPSGEKTSLAAVDMDTTRHVIEGTAATRSTEMQSGINESAPSQGSAITP